MASFRVLGPVEAWADERRLTLGGRQQVKLLAFLLLSANGRCLPMRSLTLFGGQSARGR